MGRETRNISLDIAKGIGIILVVLGHTKGPEEMMNYIYCFHMPLFFIISGYLFNYEKWKNKFDAFIYNRVERLMIPYFMTTLFFFYPFWLFLGRNFGEGKNLNISPWKEFIGIFYGSAVDHYMDFNTPLWFLPCLFIGEIIFFFGLNLIKSTNVRCATFLVISSIGAFIGHFYAMPWSIDVAMVVQIFFFFGYILKYKKIHINYVIGISSLLIMLLVVYCQGGVDTATRHYNNIILYYIGGISGTLFILWCCKLIAKIRYISKVLSYFGVQSMSVFMWHNLGFKWASICFVYGMGIQLSLAHENFFIIYTLIAILVSLLILQIKNKIQSVLIKKGYVKLACLISW